MLTSRFFSPPRHCLALLRPLLAARFFSLPRLRLSNLHHGLAQQSLSLAKLVVSLANRYTAIPLLFIARPTQLDTSHRLNAAQA